jgi:hypothetical protein
MKTVSYDIIAVDEANDWLDNIDGEFENLDVAERYLAAHTARYNAEYDPEDRGILKIRKITREYE